MLGFVTGNLDYCKFGFCHKKSDMCAGSEVTCSPFNLAPVVKLPVAGGGVDPILFGAGCEISSSSRIAAAVCNFGKRTFSHFLRT